MRKQRKVRGRRRSLCLAVKAVVVEPVERRVLMSAAASPDPSFGTGGTSTYTHVAAAALPASAAPPTASSNGTLLSGTTIGTPGSYKSQGDTIANATDGNPNTFFDGHDASGDYVGLDLGATTSATVYRVGFAPRAGYAGRMVGGLFQGSNSPDFSDASTIYTVTAAPAAGTLTVVPVTTVGAFRYVRYVGPAGGECDVAEVQFYGTTASASTGSAVFENGVLTVTGTPGADTIDVQDFEDRDSPIAVTINGVTTTFSDYGTDFVESVVVNAGAGNDTVTVEGDDFITEPLAPSLMIDAGAGDDSVTIAVNDVIAVVDGADGNDTLTAGLGNGDGGDDCDVTLNGDAGNDALSLKSDIDTDAYDVLNGGDGDDTITLPGGIDGTDQPVTVTGGAGTDTLVIAAPSYTGGPSGENVGGTVVVNLDGQQDTDIDNLFDNGDPSEVTRFLSTIEMDVENVTLAGDGFTGTVTGDASDNVLTAAGDNAGLTLSGLGGDDRLVGGTGSTTLNGGDGNDTLVAAGGATDFIGGAGTDLADYSAYTAGVTVHLDGSAASGPTADPTDAFNGDVEQVTTGSGNDVIYANDGEPETINGGAGSDTAYVDPTGDTTINVENVIGTAPTNTQLTGSLIGTTGSYANFGNTIAKAVDGNLSTYFDSAAGSGSWVGYDLGTAATITRVSYAPRSGYESRMVGGVFQGSNSAQFTTGVVNLYTVTATPKAGVLTTAAVSATGSFRYVRYLSPTNGYGNVAEVNFFGSAGPSNAPAVQLTGVAIGTTGSYQSQGNTIANALDGNLSTFFDGPTANGDFVGLDLGTQQSVDQIAFAPRSGYASRMVGGEFQASTSADFSTGVTTVYTVTAAPGPGTLTTVTLTSPAVGRYVRYLAPNGGEGNVAEVQFFE